jgi:hypothetical protein
VTAVAEILASRYPFAKTPAFLNEGQFCDGLALLAARAVSRAGLDRAGSGGTIEVFGVGA